MSDVAELPALLSHFDDREQQDASTKLGMWTFLATEVMFFGGMFLAYILYRWKYPVGFAEGSLELIWQAGFLNTGVLLCSSLSMALAVDYAKLGQTKDVLRNLLVTMVLGTTFLGVKAVEYFIDWKDSLIPGFKFAPKELLRLVDEGKLNSSDIQNVELFFVLYFSMTGLHALHMVIGIAAIGTLAAMIYRSKQVDGVTVESLGLYWHFVDLVWVFLFPLLYLIDLNHHT